MAVSYADALRYARDKRVVLSDEFYLLDLNARQYATTVSYLASLDQIRTVINLTNKAIEGGSTFQEFQKAVKESGIELSPHHLDNIFRTNIQNAYAHGIWTQQQKNKANRPYLKYSSLTDSRVRPSHLALNNIIRHIDDSFWDTHYPPNGFNCFLPNTNIDGASRGAIKRFYNGQTVELITKSGRKLRVTANHPILTARGWVAANTIEQGDNLLAYNRPVKGVDINGWSREVYNNKAIPTSENLFNAFVGHAFAAGKTSTFKFDRNFCISDCEIHIDILNSGLVININSKSVEGFSKITLEYRCNTVFSTTVLPTIRSSNRSDAVMNVVFSKDSADISSGCVADFCDFTLSDFIGFVLSKNSNLQISIGVSDGIPSGGTLAGNSTLGLFDGLPLGRFGLASGSQDNSLFNELSTNGRSGDFGLFFYLVNTHSGQVFSDPVVNVINNSYVGHVYDFQSDCGLLSANGIITHNCRCSVDSLTEAQAKRLGITIDDELPDIQPDNGWAVSPASYGKHLNDALQEKIDDALLTNTPLARKLSDIQNEALASQQANEAIVKAFEPMSDTSKQVNEAIVDRVLEKNKDIEPSAIRMLTELVKDDEQALTDLLKTSVVKNDKPIVDWMKRSFDSLMLIAKNLKSKITGNNIKGFDSLNLQKGNVIGIQTPTLFKTSAQAGKSITILDAKGIALDLSKINGLNGALLAPDLNLEVISITDSEVVLKKTNELATRLFVANNTLFNLY